MGPFCFSYNKFSPSSNSLSLRERARVRGIIEIFTKPPPINQLENPPKSV